MTVALTAHPAAQLLEAYSLGTLPADDAAEVEEHLALCDSCCVRLSTVPDDSFVAFLRESTSQPDKNGLNADETVLVRDAGSNPSADQSFAYAALANESDLNDGEVPIPNTLRNHPRYRVLERCGIGGMGVVYRAEHRLMTREVALKVIRPELLRRPEAAERFRREVQAAAVLSHPNIVSSYDAEESEGVHFLVMEYVPGKDLASIVAERGPLSVRDACEFTCQAADGLRHAYERGMAHRDVKPQNLRLTPDGRVKILDFGLSKFASEAQESVGETCENVADRCDLTCAGASLGTPDYVAPEQIADSHSADVRADIYGLGGTLYFLLTGRPPFPGQSVAVKLRRHAEAIPRAITDFRADVPPELIDVLHRMMAKRPEDRFQTPAEVAEALRPFTLVAGMEGASPAVSPPGARGDCTDIDEEDDAARRLVQSPANGILAVTVLNLVLGVWSLAAMPHVYPRDDLWSIWAAVGGISMIPATLVMMQGALRMRRLESINWAKAGAIYAVIPWTPIWFLGLPFGIWALWTLGHPIVRRGFGLDPLSPPMRRRGIIFTGLFLLLPLAAGAGGVIYIETDKGEIAIEAHDPHARIRVLQDGKVVEILDPITNESVTVDTGIYTIELGSSGFTTSIPENDEFVVHRGRRKVVTVKRITSDTESQTVEVPLIVEFSPEMQPLNTSGVEWIDSAGAWKVDGMSGRTVRLYEAELPGDGGAGIDNRLLIYRANLKTQGVTGRAYLEMWVRGINGQEYFSRGFNDAVRGTTEWVEVQTPFWLNEGEKIDQAQLNLVIEGGGTVWFRDVRLEAKPRPKALTNKASDLLGKAINHDGTRESMSDGQPASRVQEIGQIAGPKAPLFDVAFSPDGDRLVAPSDDWFLYVIDHEHRRITNRIHLDGGLRLVDLSPDGRLAAVGGILDGALPLVDLRAGELRRRLNGHREHVRSARFSSDGQRLASQSPSEIILWDVKTGREQRRIEARSQVDQPLLLSNDDRVILSAQNADIRVYDVKDGTHLRRLAGHQGRVISLALSPDGRYLASGSFDATIRLWDWQTGAMLRVLNGHFSKVTGMQFTPDGKSLISGSHDRSLRVWDVNSGREIARAVCETHDVNHVAVSPDGNLIATAGGWYTDSRGENYISEKRPMIRLWQMPKIVSEEQAPLGTDLSQFTFSGDDLTGSGIYSIAVTPDGSKAVTGHHAGPIRVWDVASRRQILRLDGHTESVGAVAFSPDGRLAVTGSHDATARLWNLATGEEIRQLIGHEGWVRSVAFSPDGQRIVTGAADFQNDRDNSLRVWNVESGQELLRLKGRRGHNEDVAFSPDGRQIVAVDGVHNCLRFWNSTTGEQLGELGEFQGIISRFAFSPDGRYLATGEHGRTLRDEKWFDPKGCGVRIWDLEKRQVILKLEGHSGAILDVAYSPDGRQLLTVSGDRHDGRGIYFEAEDRSIRLWDAESGRELTRFATGERIHCVAFLPNGETFLSGGTDSVNQWELPDDIRDQANEGVSGSSTQEIDFSDHAGRTIMAAAAILTAAKVADLLCGG